MKKTYYCSVIPINENTYLYFNAFQNSFLLLNATKNSIYQNNSPEKIAELDADFYAMLLSNGFIQDDSIDETMIVEYKKMRMKLDTTQYNVVINTTLDCNLNCWYCYESKIENSILSDEVIDIVKKNIVQKYEETPYKELKISFFGGEPLINFTAIEDILIFSKKISEQHNLHLIADFTTNATLLTDEMILFLQDYFCMFQITLDGNEEKHNKIRCFKEDKSATYRTVINNIYKIQNKISNSLIWVRVNYDNSTLEHFDQILNDISGLDPKKAFIIIRKVWQLPSDKVDKVLVMSAIQMAIDKGFYIDNYALPRLDVCFADRLNQVFFNYDGKVFKCSTLEHFNDENAEGTVNPEDGKVDWNINKIAKKMMQRSPEKCLKCKIYPVCLGPCGKNSEKGDFVSCMIDSTGLSMSEFIMYYFKLNKLWA